MIPKVGDYISHSINVPGGGFELIQSVSSTTLNGITTYTIVTGLRTAAIKAHHITECSHAKNPESAGVIYWMVGSTN
jgi:hypothetical protein